MMVAKIGERSRDILMAKLWVCVLRLAQQVCPVYARNGITPLARGQRLPEAHQAPESQRRRQQQQQQQQRPRQHPVTNNTNLHHHLKHSLSSPVSGSCVSAAVKGRERTVPGSRYRMSSVPSPQRTSAEMAENITSGELDIRTPER